MTPDCPSPEDLGAYLEGALPVSEGSPLEAHVASCFSCRTQLRVLADNLPVRSPRSRSRLWIPAAAAGFLLAAGAWQLVSRGIVPSVPPLAGFPAAANKDKDREFPAGSLLEAPARARCWALRGGGRLALAPHGRLRVISEAVLRLEAGAVWSDRLPWDTLEVSGWTVTGLSTSEAVVEAPIGRPTSPPACLLSGVFLSGAFAEEAPPACLGVGKVACLEGELRLQREKALLDVPGGRAFALGEQTRPLEPVALEAMLDWRESLYRPSSAVLARQGLSEGAPLRLPDPGMSDYRIEVRVRAERQAGDLGIAFPAGRTFPYWVQPLVAGEERFTVRRQADRIRCYRGGRLVQVIACLEADRLQARAPALELAVWGASVELLGIQVSSLQLEGTP